MGRFHTFSITNFRPDDKALQVNLGIIFRGVYVSGMSKTGVSGDIRLNGELLQCFFSECERHFRFLEQRYGYMFFCGLLEYRNNYKMIKPLNQQEFNGPFMAVTRYEKGEQAFEITYSSIQFLIEAHAFYNPIDRFELSEIMTAARKSDTALRGDWGVSDVSLIKKTIREMAQSFEKHSRILLEPGDKLLNRAMTIRHKQLEQSIREKHKISIDATCQHAAKAYREKNYRLVVQLLEPVKRYLKRGEIKKLERAKKLLFT
ncbi:MAG TPA: hypothetical protein PK513_03370 [Alphaproteobacteria bacterium]|nr:MAG: hypothetical protein H6859_08155 [Rhodospirillales bacterium]HOO81524.1 hypothetical protein [Alphaproteobacteria bacterium]